MPPSPIPHARPARAWPFLLAAAAAAVVVDLSAYHAGHQSDTLIPVMASLQKWRLFYWDQDRNGLLIALLAVPFRHPFTNLLVQCGLSAFAALAAVVLLARFVNRSAGWPVVAAAGCGLLFLGVSDFDRFHLFAPSQPYGPSMALAAGGLLALASPRSHGWRRGLVACGLFALASWVNIGLPLFIGPWLALRWVLGLCSGTRPRTWTVWGRSFRLSPSTVEFAGELIVMVFGTACGVVLSAMSDYHGTKYGWQSLDEWDDGWNNLLWGLRARFPDVVIAVQASAGLTVLWLILPPTRAAAWRAGRELAATVCGVYVAVAALAGSEWVALNEHDPRYLAPAVILLIAASANAAVGPVAAVLTGSARRVSAVAAGLAIPAFAVAAYGWPSLAIAREAVDEATGFRTESVLQAGCTHLSGEYWDVWPAVFHVNLTLADMGEVRVVWGATVRGDATRPQWSAVPARDARIGWLNPGVKCVPPKRTEEYWRTDFPTLVPVERGPRMWLCVEPPADLPAGPQAGR